MKTVVLIGDSIRMGYEETVRRELENVAAVVSSKENGGTSTNVLAHLDEWVISRDPDLVHVNCGLHDLRREFDAATAAVPLAEYTANVRSILAAIKGKTDATVIWAATTPVNEQWHHENKPFDRFEADVAAYNAAAAGIAEELGVPIDDLFAVMQQAAGDKCLRPDGVHFTAEGYTRLGEAVAACVRPYLAAAKPGAAAEGQ